MLMDPVHIQDLLLATALGAGIVLFGAAYAALLTFARLLDRPRLLVYAGASYAALVACVVAFADAARLTGSWSVLAVAMALGYLVAPLGIWRLCTGTHLTPDHGSPPRRGEDHG